MWQTREKSKKREKLQTLVKIASLWSINATAVMLLEATLKCHTERWGMWWKGQWKLLPIKCTFPEGQQQGLKRWLTQSYYYISFFFIKTLHTLKTPSPACVDKISNHCKEMWSALQAATTMFKQAVLRKLSPEVKECVCVYSMEQSRLWCPGKTLGIALRYSWV